MTTNRRAEGIGAARPRSEDQRLVSGQGRYTSDYFPKDLCYAVMVRSPYPHARIRSIDATRATALPGVLAILTGADALADGLSPIPHNPDWKGPPDVELRLPPDFDIYLTDNPVLPPEVVRYVGEAVAVVLAATDAAATSAAELVEVDYEELPAVVDARVAIQEGAPQLWPQCERNLALTCEVGDAWITEDAFAKAAHVVRLTTHVHRVTGSPMEPRAVVAEYDASSDRYSLRAASGRGVVQTRERLATILGVDKSRCRVSFGDMGGNFGTRNAFSPEYALAAWAARKVGRPVKWTASRSECFLSDYQARDLAVEAELALDARGNFLAMRGVNTLNLGAYTAYFWPLRKGLSMMQSVYRIPAVHFRGHAVLTNTAPIAVYRSAGRPEAIFVIERLIELAAKALEVDPLELRRENLIARDEMPFTNAVGVTYDSGDYVACMATALATADWDRFAERRAESASRHRCRGIGIANYIEVTSGIPRERAELTVCEDGSVELVVGTASSGQGHQTSFAQLVADWLEIPFDDVRFVANDTERVSVGGGSHSGRSMRLVSIAVDDAVRAMIEQGKSIAAHVLQDAVSDISYSEGCFTSPGGASITLAEAAHASRNLTGLPDTLRGGLRSAGDITNRAGGYPYGSHVCEVEVDPETGVVDIVDWTCIDDVGLAVNPLILHGQAHGAATQGIGQALMEHIHYDPDNGQLMTGSYLDYAMPRAMDVPAFRTVVTEVPASSHPHGIRPGGEGGTTPALAVVVNAVVDALAGYGVAHIEMPLTPERVWRAIKDASLDTKSLRRNVDHASE